MPQKSAQPPAKLTRKQQRHLRRDEIQTRIVLAVLAGVLVLVAGVIGIGYLRAYVIRLQEPLAVVNGESITVDQWQKEVRYQRLQYVDQWQTYVAMAQMESDDTYRSFYESYATQIQSMLDNPSSIGYQVLGQMVNGLVIRQQAAAMGIEVSDREVQERIEQYFLYTPAATLTAMPSPTTAPTATEAPTATVDPSLPTVEATPTLSATQQAMLLPTMEPTPYTEEAFQTSFSGFLDTLSKRTGMSEAEFRERVRTELLTAKVREAVVSEVARDQMQYHLERISVSDEVTAEVARERVVGGEDFGAVAAEMSTDATAGDDGGDIGWIGPGILPDSVEETVFALEVGGISEPVQTDTYTWAVFRLVEKEVRPLEDIPYEAAKTAYYNNWLQNLKTEDAVQIFDFADDILPKDPTVS
jgi:parvulin-like peptidyl-prolyl isomerase